ncbi:MAG: sigma-70 family RNA polymerase sigma factor [Candidatus Eisenbacteria bacterium]|uniref:Sigma-70 family RNA polymerase sigma factor n=1 Tax=Eiseniibacteriota bacterium TaxID=2212470 RepID=A0A956LXW7_UNCEI|nr:sigma-70 family RNA polymerase sigma factor [Candidatus Eisenbacteria bacterium]
MLRENAERDEVLEAACSGDGEAFGRLAEPFRRELQAHCYRMLGSVQDAEDALQDSLLRAWKGIGAFERRSSVRTWLYAIATRRCLDLAVKRRPRLLPADLGPASSHVLIDDRPVRDIPWLEPYPEPADLDENPGARLQQREASELAFVAALQHLTGNQRAALLLFDVLGFSAAEIATMMDTSVASVNSALQRSRSTLQDRIGRGGSDPSGDGEQAFEVARAFADALERRDPSKMIELLTDDVTWSMPPLPGWYRGLPSVGNFAARVPLGACGEWRTRMTRANGHPAVAAYLKSAPTDGFDAWSINVLTLAGTRIRDVTSFIGSAYFARFGLPLHL